MLTLSQLEASAQRRAAEAAAAAAVSEYRATRTPRITVNKPTPEMYGLCDGFDFDEYDLENQKFRRNRLIGLSITYVAIGAIVTVIGASIVGLGPVNDAVLSVWCYVLFGSPLLGFVYSKSKFDYFLKELFFNYLTYSDNARAGWVEALASHEPQGIHG